MSKVFTDFLCNFFVNKALMIIPIGAAIAIIGILAISFEDSEIMEVEDTLNREVIPEQEITKPIQEKIEEIEKMNQENTYSPKPREWITSGPFQIDRSEYILGEKVFLRIGGLSFEEKGQVAFLRPLNSTHYSVYVTIPFDGADKPAFNYYIEPDLARTRGICTVDDLVGDWRVVFRGTNYSNLEFKVTEQILPGDEAEYKPVC